MRNTKLLLSVLPIKFAICRLKRNEQIPTWALNSDFYSISKTADELSIVCEENKVPDGVKFEGDWRAIRIEGPLDFSMTGVLASIAKPLGDAKISIFAISTFDTDYVLVKENTLGQAITVLGVFCDINA